jgi:putative SOS response-associated peptidase YedK
MCGRFTLRTSPQLVTEIFGLSSLPDLQPRYNVAPTQPVAVVRATPQGRELAWLRWGLIPSWADDPRIGNRLINARSETVATKPAFRAAFKSRRCLIVADGFYEWQSHGGKKQPFFITRKDDLPFGFAGGSGSTGTRRARRSNPARFSRRRPMRSSNRSTIGCP